MEINVETENEDGSANCTVNLTSLEASYLINFAIVKALEEKVAKGKEYTPKEYDNAAIVISELKETLVSTYLFDLVHEEDVAHNLRVRQGCKDLLRHYMVWREAENYISQIESIHEEEQ